MMTWFDCRFDFHPVGQGLFYSGRVNDFCFVYDCGTFSGDQYLQAAIDAYDAPTSKLDLLIISHFHEDHINGVKKLLKKTKGAKQVILPYLFPAERLMAAAGYAIKNDLDKLDEDYISFLKDPVTHLRDNGADDAIVTFLQPGEAVANGPDAGEQTDGGYGWYPKKPLSKADFPELANTSKRVAVRADRSIYRNRDPLWGFKFYCEPSRVSVVAIKQKLAASRPPIAVDDLAVVLRNRLDELKDIYRILFPHNSGGQNSTSVVCCHGPAVPRGNGGHLVQGHADISVQLSPASNAHHHWHALDGYIGHCFFDCHWIWRRRRNSWFLFPPLQLLTGDANLKLTEFQTYFAAELDAIGLVLLPHHGSKHNWRKDFLKKMSQCQLWVASAGLGSKYKHPSKAVVDEIVAAKKQLLLSNEVQHVAIAAKGRRLP